MSRLPNATKRRDLIKRFRDLGWTGPKFATRGSGKGRSHPAFMVHHDGRTVKLPNEHKGGDIREPLLKMLLDEARISHEEWLGERLPDKPDEDSTA